MSENSVKQLFNVLIKANFYEQWELKAFYYLKFYIYLFIYTFYIYI